MEELQNNLPENIALIDMDKIIRSQKSIIVRRLPRFMVNIIKRIVHQEEINQQLIEHQNQIGVNFIKANMKSFNISTETIGLENLPDDGRFIFVCNHPLGGVDFYAAIVAADQKYTKIKVIANEILLNLKNLRPLFLPVNAFGKSPQEYHKLINEAYAGDYQIMTFPAGEVSRKRNGQIKDRDWHRSFVRNAINYQRDIIPMYIHAKNSNRFYFIGRLRQMLGIKLNLELFLLPDELFKQKNKKIYVVIGKPISYTTFSDDKPHFEIAQEVKERVYGLKNQLDRNFLQN